MKMFKNLLIASVCVAPLLLSQCKSTTSTAETVTPINQTAQDMEMRNPAFAKAKTTFHTWLAGTQEGGSGIKMEFDWKEVPENLVFKQAFFRGMTAPIQQGQSGYWANFTLGQNAPKDVIMHSDQAQEAVNTPPAQKATFPVKLTDKEVGIIYEENGQLLYTIINNLTEKPQIAYPSAPPKGDG